MQSVMMGCLARRVALVSLVHLPLARRKVNISFLTVIGLVLRCVVRLYSLMVCCVVLGVLSVISVVGLCVVLLYISVWCCME